MAAATGSQDPEVGLAAVAALRGLVEVLETLQVERARALGWPWPQIAARLGVTKQAVHKSTPAGGFGWGGGRMVAASPLVRRVLELASEEAARFGHHSMGPEHLLLGMLREDAGPAARVLHAQGVDLQAGRAALREWFPGTLGGTVLSVNELDLLGALRRGDERAFATLVDRHGASMLRLARAYVRDRAVAEEVVQEAWLGVLRGLERFEGRSSLATWLHRIVANLAKTRAVKEARSVPFSALAGPDVGEQGPSVPPERFRGPEDRWAGHWATPPHPWGRPDAELLSAETRDWIVAAIDALPQLQRQVITLRDVEGWSAEEVCNVLELSETNQRVLLHRARTKVRQALNDYLIGS